MTAITSAAVFLIMIAGLLVIVWINIVKAPPDTAVIVTGRRRLFRDPETGEQKTVGFRVLTAGSTIRIPILERVDYLPLGLVSLAMEVTDATSSDGAHVSVGLIANVKIGSDDRSIVRATERLLNIRPEQLRDIVGHTIDSRVRAIVAGTAFDDVTRSRQLVAQMITTDVERDLAAMGVVVDQLTLHEIAASAG